MYYEFLAVLFVLSGFFMKFSDDAYDIDHNKLHSLLLGIVCAVASALATIYSGEAACIFIGILIGNFLAFKVDGFHHIITMIIFIVIVAISGIPYMGMVVLLICIFAALSDEIGHEMVSKKISNRFVNLFFEYRFTMKVAIFLLVVFGIFNIWIFVCFLLFEISYEFAGFCYGRFIEIF